MFCVGTVTGGLQGSSFTCLCVAIKRTIQVYELNKTRQKFRKLKEIQVPGQVQCLEVMSQGLCVGCPSYFAIYSVQGDSPPTGMCILRVNNCLNIVWQSSLQWNYCFVIILICSCERGSCQCSRIAKMLLIWWGGGGLNLGVILITHYTLCIPDFFVLRDVNLFESKCCPRNLRSPTTLRITLLSGDDVIDNPESVF